MRRHLALLLSAALTATPGALTSVAPAHASGVCSGLGTMSVGGAGLFFPGAVHQGGPTLTIQATPQTLPFNLSFSLANTCAPNPAKGFSAGGMVSGWCGHTWGQGITGHGYRFAWVQAGPLLLLTGALEGKLTMVPDILAGQSCATGALGFVVSGSVTKVTCTTKSKTSHLTAVPGTHQLVGNPATHVTVPDGSYHTWTKACAGVL
ncbi:MAG TPA: hypothetical protein VHF47_09780 [Acidimicrobiales bacterium]|nr:hypothetical protein [Acidimicrobiales bacterium]